MSAWAPCLFHSEDLLLTCYVDDLSVWSRTPEALEELRDQLRGMDLDTTAELGDSGRLLGMAFRIDYEQGTIELDCAEKEEELLRSFDGGDGQQRHDTPMEAHTTLPFIEEVGGHPRYRELCGSLLFLCHVRPELGNAVRQLCRHAHRNDHRHWAAAKRVLGYLRATKGQCLTLRKSAGPPSLRVWSDASFGEDLVTRRGCSGAVYQFGGSTFHASSRSQQSQARSTCESELLACNECAFELLYYRRVLHEIGEEMERPTELLVDSRALVGLLERPVLSSKSKHIDNRALAVRAMMDEGVVALRWVPSEDELADLLTKALGGPTFKRLAARVRGDEGAGAESEAVADCALVGVKQEECWVRMLHPDQLRQVDKEEGHQAPKLQVSFEGTGLCSKKYTSSTFA